MSSRKIRLSPQYKEFLRRLAAARTATGMTQREVASRIGEPHSYIAKCETGERRVDVVELSLLARIYGKSLEYFDPFHK